MNLSLKTTKKPEQKARVALRNGKWKSALPFFDEQAHADEQNFTQWNLLGDIQFRAGDIHAASVSWQYALDGFAQESLHENVLGIGRKISKRCPEETEVYRSISEANLGLEYYADAIIAFRSYTKLAKNTSGLEMKNWFRKIMNCEIKQPHLLDELTQLYDDCALEDIELQREVQAYIKRMHEQVEVKDAIEVEEVYEPATVVFEQPEVANNDGLMTIETDWKSSGLSFVKQDAVSYQQSNAPYEPPVQATEYEVSEEFAEEDLPMGQGKDHYDLGVVYAEMKLWDAAITEFKTARRDQSIRRKATIELAQCFKNSNDPHRALRLLEEESAVTSDESGVQDDLHYHMGVLNETLGNMTAAVGCFDKVSSGSTYSGDATARANRLR